MGAQGIYTIVGALPRGSSNQTVLAIREGGKERRGIVLRPWDAGVAPFTPPALPGLVPVLGFDAVKGLPVALYEFSPGVTLREILEAFKVSQRRAPLGLAGRVVVDAARVISSLHTQGQAIVHGCLHDGAVLVGFDGATKLIDVGAGRRSRFEAPEVARGEPPTVRSDIYALAALAHAAATGFGSTYAPVGVRGATSSDLPPPSRHHADAKPELDAALNRALTTNPLVRATSARLFAEELERALGDRLFSREQVGATLSELFGDRLAALKSLVLKATAETGTAPRPSRPKGSGAEAPGAPRPSAPRPRPSRPAAPPPEVHPGSDVPVDTQAGQGGVKVLVETEDRDPHITKPERPKPSASLAPKRSSRPDQQAVRPAARETLDELPSLGDEPPDTGLLEAHRPEQALVSLVNAPETDAQALGIEDVPTAMRPRVTGSRPALGLKQQTEEEKAAAAGQEKISTAELDPEDQGELAQLRDEEPPPAANEPTNVKGRPAPPPGRRPLEDEPEPPRRRSSRGGKVLLTVVVLLGAFAGLSWQFRPWRGKPLPAWTPPRVMQLLVDDGALPPGGAPLEVVQLDESQVAPPPAQELADGGAADEGALDGGGAAVAPGAAAVLAPLADGGVATEDAGAAAAGGAGAAAAQADLSDAGSALDAGAVAAAEESQKAEKPAKKKRRRR